MSKILEAARFCKHVKKIQDLNKKGVLVSQSSPLVEVSALLPDTQSKVSKKYHLISLPRLRFHIGLQKTNKEINNKKRYRSNVIIVTISGKTQTEVVHCCAAYSERERLHLCR